MARLLDLSEFCQARMFFFCHYSDFKSLALTCRRLGFISRMTQSMNKDHWRRKSYWFFLDLILRSVNRDDHTASICLALKYKSVVQEILGLYVKFSFSWNYEALLSSASDEILRNYLPVLLAKAEKMLFHSNGCGICTLLHLNVEDGVQIQLKWDYPEYYENEGADLNVVDTNAIQVVKIHGAEDACGESLGNANILLGLFPPTSGQPCVIQALKHVMSSLIMHQDGNIVSKKIAQPFQSDCQLKLHALEVENLKSVEANCRKAIQLAFDRLLDDEKENEILVNFLNVLRKSCQRLTVQQACLFLFDLFTNTMVLFSAAECFSYGEQLGYWILVRPILLCLVLRSRICNYSEGEYLENLSFEFPTGDILYLSSTEEYFLAEVESHGDDYESLNSVGKISRAIETYLLQLFTEEELSLVPEISERFVLQLCRNLLLYPDVSFLSSLS